MMLCLKFQLEVPILSVHSGNALRQLVMFASFVHDLNGRTLYYPMWL